MRLITNTKTLFVVCAVLWSSVGLPAQQTAPAAVNSYFVGRAFLNPATGEGQVVGYFAVIRGIAGTLFKGAPSEATAFFTFRSDVFSLTLLPVNGDVALDLVSAGTFDLYYNANPNGDWNNPDTFSSGQLIARFSRNETLFLQIGPVSEHVLTESLVSSQAFTFNGKKYDFKCLAPGGITLRESVSNTGVPGVNGFPVGLAFAGHGVAVGKSDNCD